MNYGNGKLAYYPSFPGDALDIKFTVSETAVYKVDVDLEAMTCKITKL